MKHHVNRPRVIHQPYLSLASEPLDKQLTVTCPRLGRQYGDIQWARPSASRRHHSFRGVSTRVAAAGATTIVRERTLIYQIRIRLCLGRARGRHEAVDGRQVLECEQSIWQFPDLPRDGGQARRRWLRPSAGSSGSGKSRQDTRKHSRK